MSETVKIVIDGKGVEFGSRTFASVAALQQLDAETRRRYLDPEAFDDFNSTVQVTGNVMRVECQSCKREIPMDVCDRSSGITYVQTISHEPPFVFLPSVDTESVVLCAGLEVRVGISLSFSIEGSFDFRKLRIVYREFECGKMHYTFLDSAYYAGRKIEDLDVVTPMSSIPDSKSQACCYGNGYAGCDVDLSGDWNLQIQKLKAKKISKTSATPKTAAESNQGKGDKMTYKLVKLSNNDDKATEELNALIKQGWKLKDIKLTTQGDSDEMYSNPWAILYKD